MDSNCFELARQYTPARTTCVRLLDKNSIVGARSYNVLAPARQTLVLVQRVALARPALARKRQLVQGVCAGSSKARSYVRAHTMCLRRLDKRLTVLRARSYSVPSPAGQTLGRMRPLAFRACAASTIARPFAITSLLRTSLCSSI